MTTSASQMIQRFCNRCGTGFQGTGKDRWCSEDCRRPNRRIMRTMTCSLPSCGKTFERLLGRDEPDRKFCSFECNGRSMAGVPKTEAAKLAAGDAVRARWRSVERLEAENVRLADEIATLKRENEALRRRVDELRPPWQSRGFDPSTTGEL